MSNYIAPINFENARILFRNFRGAESKYNRAGDRNFCVIIDNPEDAKKLTDEGWNVKTLPATDEYEDETYYIMVSVSFKYRAPDVYLISNGNKTQLDEESIGQLDTADIANADLSIRPYTWSVNGKSGVKAYLNTLYVTLEEDPFAAKYSHVDQNNVPW